MEISLFRSSLRTKIAIAKIRNATSTIRWCSWTWECQTKTVLMQAVKSYRFKGKTKAKDLAIL